MDILIRYGFSVDEIKNIMNTNEEINNVSDKDINNIITLLEKNGCKINHIKNIIITNPFVLTREIDELEKTILVLINITDFVELLLDTNPFLLNMSDRDINSLIKNLGLSKNDLLDYLYFNI